MCHGGGTEQRTPALGGFDAPPIEQRAARRQHEGKLVALAVCQHHVTELP